MEFWRVVLFSAVVLFLSSIPFSVQEKAFISVRAARSIASTDASFICSTIDWWPKEKCSYQICPWGNTSILLLDLENPVFHKALKAFDSMRIRIGGSLQDQVVYNVGNKYPTCEIFRKQPKGLFGFSQGCLSMSRWDKLNAFFNDTGVKLTFGLNALIGRKQGQGTLYIGDWDYNNARDFVNYTASKGYNLDSWELGNELSGSGVGAKVDPEQYGKDMINLRKIVDQVYQNSTHKPKVLAPGGFYDKKWFEKMLQTSGPWVVNGVTHHIYNLGPGDDPELIHKMQDPYYLDQVSKTYRDITISINKYSPWSRAWIGESGGAYNSGGINISNTYVNSFWYLDQLGMVSTYDHKVHCRQSLIGGNYGLLDTTTFVPNPDYYSALLWSRLMGTAVLQTTITGSPYLRAYTHCSKNQNGVTMLLINLSNSTTFYLHVTKDMNLHPPQHSSSLVFEGGQREEYHLTPKDGYLKSRVMLLNGKPLALTSSGDIPELTPVTYSSNDPLKMAPSSIAFVRFKDFTAPACQ